MSMLSMTLQPGSLTGLSISVEHCDEAIGAGLASALADLGAVVEMRGRDPIGLEEQCASVGERWGRGTPGIDGNSRFADDRFSPDALIRMFSRPTLSRAPEKWGHRCPSPAAGTHEAAIRICSMTDIAHLVGRDSPRSVEIWIVTGARPGDRELLEGLLLNAPGRPRHVQAIALSIAAGSKGLRGLINLSQQDSDALASLVAFLLGPAGRNIAEQCFWLGADVRY